MKGIYECNQGKDTQGLIVKKDGTTFEYRIEAGEFIGRKLDNFGISQCGMMMNPMGSHFGFRCVALYYDEEEMDGSNSKAKIEYFKINKRNGNLVRFDINIDFDTPLDWRSLEFRDKFKRVNKIGETAFNFYGDKLAKDDKKDISEMQEWINEVDLKWKKLCKKENKKDQ